MVAQGKQFAQNRDKEQVLEAEQQLVARKFDARDEEGNGTIDRQQVSRTKYSRQSYARPLQ